MFEFPEPLFESFVEGKRLCLACATRPATRALWTTREPVVPLCAECVAEWNLHGYLLLKRIKPGQLVTHLIRYKLLRLLSGPPVAVLWQDMRTFMAWGGRMKKFRERSGS